MKRFTAAVAAILCVMLTGCSGDSGNSPSGRNTEIGSVSPSPSMTERVSEPESADVETSPAGVIPPAESSEPAAEESVPEATAAPQHTEEPPPADVTKQIAAFDNTFLGLPSADKVYIFSDAGKSAEIDGYSCSAVSCYDEYEGTLYYMCDFYISPDGSRVYRYYEQEERFAILPEEQMTRLDPTRQSLEEIFAESGRLYGMFHPATNAAVEGIDRDAEPTEINGESYLPVTEGQINSKAALLDALDGYFSGEIVTALMETSQFVELDGVLYVRELSGAGSNPNLESIEYELTELTEDTAVFTEYDTYRYEAGESEVKEVVYKAEKQNGLWRFTDYTAPWTIH